MLLKYNIERYIEVKTSDRYRSKSEKSMALIVPKTKFTSRGDRAFCTAAPRLLNKLPVEIRRSQSVQTFKTGLKTYLFHNHVNMRMTFLALLSVN